ncbi:Testicular haploid expressed gene protein-like isoform X2 [Oopsacas minuta]|uniref:Testicular haploid expressed gene protein-like isoform X2 n=1 Tax=Oopsacas minuta TaxID=111878 RepID=A0AAV7JCT1_9METZ|nr:Testicular haploid expressed gene protein-like isoform X2 [Oopsacas minuta]
MPSSVSDDTMGVKQSHKRSESDGSITDNLNKPNSASKTAPHTRSNKSRQLAFSSVEAHRTHLPHTHHVRRIKSSPAPTRFLTLSLPKQTKSTWETSFWPELRWGNQEPIRPISRYALIANPSSRVESLALAKKSFRMETEHISEHAFSCGRSSPIWEVGDAALMARPTDRLLRLAQHKEPPQDFIDTMDRPNNAFSCGRSSPIWQVCDNARTAKVRPHTARLASAKGTHYDYKEPRSVQSAVSTAAKMHSSSERTEELSKPKHRYPEQVRSPQWDVSEVAKSANASSRTIDLSKSKSLSDRYQPSRDVAWFVSQASLYAVASNRLEELAKPIKRETMDHLQFNPDAFKVSTNALKGKPSKRLEELSEPLERLKM